MGGGFNRATKVTFGGVKTTNFTVASPTLIQAIVPAGAKTGHVAVTTPNGAAASKETFTVS
ncbi:MAG: IPT/TIG domain-containing protein [Terriglobales bacterium]